MSLVMFWDGALGRVTPQCCSEAGATPLSQGHQEARRALPVGLAPFHVSLSQGFISTSTWQGWGGGRWGNKLWVHISAAPPPSVFCLAGRLALLARFGEAEHFIT